jgi:serine/threonine-protein kinase
MDMISREDVQIEPAGQIFRGAIDSAPVPLPPSIEDKYEILAKISEGGMGAVYKVRHRLLDEVRVIKVVLPHAGPMSELRDRFLGEARAASRLSHPNIARILDFLVDEEGQQLLELEHIDGPTLREVLERSGPPPLGLAVEIARQALEALGALHRCGFVHRDVAPDNLMVTRGLDGGPLVKLIDLGIVKELEDLNPGLTQTGVFLGKPLYATPEQFAGEPVDARSDLYSFGIVLYELLTGRYPYRSHSVHELLAEHLQGEPLAFDESDPEGRVPPGLRAIVLRLLEKRPEDRFADAGEAAAALAPFAAPWPAEALDAILAEPPAPEAAPPLPVAPAPSVASEPARRTVQPREPSPRRLAPRLAAAALALAVLIGLGIWAMHKRSAETALPEDTPAVQQPEPTPTLPPLGDLPAQPLDRPAPLYPAEALAFGLPVRVTVDLTVDDRGRVVKAAAPFMDAEREIPRAHYRRFREAALEAARALNFRPATRNGEPVRDKVRLVIEVSPR